MSHFQPMLSSLEDFQAQFERLEGQETQLLALKDQFIGKLAAIPVSNDRTLSNDSALYQQSLRLQQALEQSIGNWAACWEQASPMRALSDAFSDRVIFLVFGKVNAGKSSFCNFIAEQFPEESVRHFYLSKGKISYFDGVFEEGITETTARIQGMELGPRLVFLDSPGLHSVTDENGDLTRRFIDSADGVIWLTSSVSPAQTQELEDLREQLQSQKPLLPVITRSDEVIEDVDENDCIIEVLFNKTPESRALQEEDVAQRTTEILKVDGKSMALMKPPVSISVHSFRASGGEERDFAESGMSRLVEQLVQLLDESCRYKEGKATQQMLNFLDCVVLQQLAEDILPEVAALQSEAHKTKKSLHHRRQLITSTVISEICLAIPMLVERHKATRNEQALAEDLNQQIDLVLNATLQQELAEFAHSLERVCTLLDSDCIGHFEDITLEVRCESGSRSKAALTGLASTLGMLAGSFMLPGAGTAIGGVLGGVAGNQIGNQLIEVSYHKEIVGISSEQVINKTTDSVKDKLPQQIEAVVQQVIKLISAQEDYAQSVLTEIKQFQRDVEGNREKL